MTTHSTTIDQKQLAYQAHENALLLDLVGTGGHRLRTANCHLGSSVRFMPLFSDGHVCSWEVGGPAHILTVICAMNYMAEELQKPVQRHAYTNSSLASENVQLFFQSGEPTRSSFHAGNRFYGCGLRRFES